MAEAVVAIPGRRVVAQRLLDSGAPVSQETWVFHAEFAFELTFGSTCTPE